MANTLPHLLLFSLFLMPLSTLAQANGTVTVGSSLSATDASTPWLSPSEDFAFGFHELNDDKGLFVLSIWFHKIPDKTIVWYANEGKPVPRESKVNLTTKGGLVLIDPQGNELWSTSDSVFDEVAYGFMNDTGNFVIVRSSDSARVWESFKNPTDTMLPTQTMDTGGLVSSRLTDTNLSRGRFQLRLLQDGNLVLNTRNMATDWAYDSYYASGTNDPANSTNSGEQVMFNETGYLNILRRNGQTDVLISPKMVFPARDYYHRATLEFDGVLIHYSHPKNLSANPGWSAFWSVPDNICFAIGGGLDSGACGYNSICSVNGNRPICECPPGFSLVDPNDKHGSCKLNFTQSCEEKEGLASPGDVYGFVELDETNWPTSDYELLKPYTEVECKKSCLQDCLCVVAVFGGDACWKKKIPLSNGRKGQKESGTKAFLKYRRNASVVIPPQIRRPKQHGTLILVGSVLLGTSFLVNFVFVGAFCLGFLLIYRKKIMKDNNIVGTNLGCFTYKELAEATHGFKEELGRGSFGIVYKGVIQTLGGRNFVAVKKLDRVNIKDSDKEFKTEVNVIGQTHHKNLVRLLGFCEEGQHRMLVYELMSNGTLASFLFGGSTPSWSQRSQIAFGIARGLLYLHEECCTQIIHCDIKPQNILLDDHYNARISDFGLAKLLMLDQSHTNTGIRGTRGYVAPEWFRSKPITAKVDVYSFGVLLLEIVCCRRSLEEDLEIGGGGGERAILTDWVCDCFQAGRVDALVENDMEALNDWEKLERFVMVGIWCIQEDPSLRPTMRKVTQLLEGVVEMTVPPSPYQFSITSEIERDQPAIGPAISDPIS